MTTHGNDRPQPLSPILTGFPPELIRLDNWVLWRYVPPKSGAKKWRKVPFQPNGKPAVTTDRSTWSAFDACSAVYAQRGFDGLGFVFDGEIGLDGLCYCGIDFDGCIENKKIHSLARERFMRLKTYSECSVSGTGLHCIARAKPLDRIVKYDGVEIYTDKRFFTFTGRTLGSSFANIAPAENEVQSLEDEVRSKQAAEQGPHSEEAPSNETTGNSWYEALSLEKKDEIVDYALAMIAQNTCFLELEANGGNNAEYFKLVTAVARSGAPHAEDIFIKYASQAKDADTDDALRQHFSRCRDSQTPVARAITVSSLLYVAQQSGASFDRWKQQRASEETSFVDPYDEFVGPPFPLDILTPTLRIFVDKLSQAMGADPSAVSMVALTSVAGAIRNKRPPRRRLVRKAKHLDCCGGTSLVNEVADHRESDAALCPP